MMNIFKAAVMGLMLGYVDAHALGVLISATSNDFTKYHFVTIAEMTTVCNLIHNSVEFHCDNIWMSGAIGAFDGAVAHHMSDFNRTEYDTIEDGHIVLVEEAIHQALHTHNIVGENDYTWRAVKDVPILPVT